MATTGTAIWFGDTTCAGTGATTPANRYSSLVTTSLELNETNKASGNTGYTTSPALADQIDATTGLDAGGVAYVFLMAGLCDPYGQLAAEQSRVADTIGKAKAKWPKARIVVGCGPGCIPADATDQQVAEQGHVLTAIRLAAQDAGALTIPDLRAVCGNDPDNRASGINPNDDGHKLIAQAILTAVKDDQGEPLDTPVTDLKRKATAAGTMWDRNIRARRERDAARREANRPTGTELTNLTGKLDELTRAQGLQQVILEQQQDQLAEQQRMLKEQQDQLAAQQKQLKSVQDQQASMLSTLQSQQTQLGQMQSNLENSIRSYINTNLVPTLNANFAKVDDRFDKLEARVGKLEQGTPA